MVIKGWVVSIRTNIEPSTIPNASVNYDNDYNPVAKVDCGQVVLLEQYHPTFIHLSTIALSPKVDIIHTYPYDTGIGCEGRSVELGRAMRVKEERDGMEFHFCSVPAPLSPSSILPRTNAL